MMKIKLDKEFLKVMGIAVICSFVATICLAFLSLGSWGLVFETLMVLFMPLAQGGIKFYKKKRCSDLEDFFHYLMEDEEEEKYSTIDW